MYRKPHDSLDLSDASQNKAPGQSSRSTPLNQDEKDEVLKEYFYRQALAKQQSKARKKANKRKRLLIIGGFLIAVFVLCVWVYASLFITGFEQQEDWIVVTDTFMHAMANKNLNKAYTMCSNQFQNQVPVSELEVFLNDPMFALYDGYLEMEISAWEITSTLEGKFVEMNGTVTYKGGYTGNFNGVLKEEGNEWKIDYFEVNVPPEKLESNP